MTASNGRFVMAFITTISSCGPNWKIVHSGVSPHPEGEGVGRNHALVYRQHLHHVQSAHLAAGTQQRIDLHHPCHEVLRGLDGLRVQSGQL